MSSGTLQKLFVLPDYSHHQIFKRENLPEVFILMNMKEIDLEIFQRDIHQFQKLWGHEEIIKCNLQIEKFNPEKLSNLIFMLPKSFKVEKITVEFDKETSERNFFLETLQDITILDSALTEEDLENIIDAHEHLKNLSIRRCTIKSSLSPSYHFRSLDEITIENNIFEGELQSLSWIPFGSSTKSLRLRNNNLEKLDITGFLLMKFDYDFEIDLRDNINIQLTIDPSFYDDVRDNVSTGYTKKTTYKEIFERLDDIFLVDDHILYDLRDIKKTLLQFVDNL